MKDQRIYLAHILECIDKIELYVVKGREFFHNDTMTQDAVIRNLEVIGEASRRIDAEFHRIHPELPWKELIGMRNILIHQYEKVDMEEVWGVVEKDLPCIKRVLSRFLPSLEQLEAEIAGEES